MLGVGARIKLEHCEVIYTEGGCTTRFWDGASVDATPHPGMSHYHVIAHRTGYDGDLMRYCREHEVCHELVSEAFLGLPSHVLWTLAHSEPQNRGMVLYEEMAAQALQRWIRANERPIISGCDWDSLKRDALELLEPD